MEGCGRPVSKTRLNMSYREPQQTNTSKTVRLPKLHGRVITRQHDKRLTTNPTHRYRSPLIFGES